MVAPTAKLGPFLGMNNRLPAHALHVPQKGDYLADVVNADLDNTGRLTRRSGFTQLVALTAGRSLFSDGVRTVCADAGVLLRVNPSHACRAPLTAVHPTNPIAYVSINGEIFFSDGVRLGCIELGWTVRQVGIEVPQAPTVTLITGNLPAGSYQCGLSYFMGSEEGGISPSTQLQVSSGVSIALPSPPPYVTHYGIYLSTQNGDVMYLHSVVEVTGATTYDVTTPSTLRNTYTQFKFPMPPGNILAYFNGRLLVASGTMLYWSDPYNYGMTSADKNYAAFPKTITIIAPCVNGIYIVTDKTYWLTGLGTDEMNLLEVLPYGAVAGTSVFIQNQEQVAWMSLRGIVIGDAQGQVQNHQETNVAVSTSTRGAMLHRRTSVDQLICSLQEPITLSGLENSDYIATYGTPATVHTTSFGAPVKV